MALNNDTAFPPSGLPPYRIDRNWCIGDSLGYINANFLNFDTRIEAVSTSLVTSVNGLSSIFPLTQQFIGTAAVSSSQLAPFAAKTANLADRSVTNAKLADNAVDGRTIQNFSIGPNKLANLSIGSDQIENGAVTDLKISSFAVTSSKLAPDSVTETKIAGNSITTAKIQVNAVTLDRIQQLPGPSVLGITNPSVGTNVQAIVPVNTNRVLLCNSSNQVLFGLVNNSMLDTNSVTSSTLADSSVTNSKISNLQVTENKLAPNSVSETKLINDSVSTSKIQNNSITSNKLASDSVTTTKILNDAVTTLKLQNDAVTTIKIADQAITTIKLADNAVTTAKLDINSVTDANIALNAVTTTKIADNSITTNKLQDNSVTTAKLTLNVIANSNLQDNSVSTNKLQNNSVTLEKIIDTVRQTLVPTGCIMAFGRAGTVPGWLLCQGGYVLKSQYPDLWNAIGEHFGPATTTQFLLPDLRGKFLRGYGFNSGALWQTQPAYAGYNSYYSTTDDGDNQANTADRRGEMQTLFVNGFQVGYGNVAFGQSRAWGPFNINTIPGDTRPENIAVYYYIKT